ncbi:hypothetical protein ACSDR0_25180 [Streptosporangium sp. G11]|uniref:hypothetical protein n=1 Tax=Streptosporangium sp. G11 TaxID=3436926 RepID=UPI003EBBFC92
MPHIDIKYRSDVLGEDQLVGAVDLLIEVVAKHFQERPEFVSLEISPQHNVVKNRKTVDIEVDSSPDPGGVRAGATKALSEELSAVLGRHLEELGFHGTEISAWVRVFSAGTYTYHRTSD